MNILLDYYILTYNNNQCVAKISDFFIFEFKKKRSIYYILLIFIIYADKQN